MIAEVTIKAPIWNGGNRKIGIADYRIKKADIVEVEILAKDKDGNKLHPGTYWMPVAKLKKYPIQTVHGGTKLYVSPIEDWDIK